MQSNKKNKTLRWSVLILIILISSNLHSQTRSQKWDYKKSALGFGVAFIGGMNNGLNQTLVNHYTQFKEAHPNINDQYWDPSISWKNKYKNFDGGDFSENYIGSKTFMVWTTDAYHLTSQLSNASIISSTCIITIGKKRKWWEYGTDILITGLARSAGFHLVYSGIYK